MGSRGKDDGSAVSYTHLLSGQEEKILSDWRGASRDNEAAFQKMTSENFYTNGMERLEAFDSRVAYGRFLQRKYQQRRARCV